MQINKLNKQLKPKARREWCFSEESKLVQGKDRTTDKLANRVLASDSKAHRAVNRGESVNRDNPKIHILKREEERSTVDPLRLDYSMTATRFCAWQEFVRFLRSPWVSFLFCLHFRCSKVCAAPPNIQLLPDVSCLKLRPLSASCRDITMAPTAFHQVEPLISIVTSRNRRLTCTLDVPCRHCFLCLKCEKAFLRRSSEKGRWTSSGPASTRKHLEGLQTAG